MPVDHPTAKISWSSKPGIGPTEIGGSVVELRAHTKRLHGVVSPISFVAESFRAYMDGLGPGDDTPVRALAYDTSGNLAGTGSTVIVKSGQQPGWVDLPISIELVADEPRIIGVHIGPGGCARLYGDEIIETTVNEDPEVEPNGDTPGWIWDATPGASTSRGPQGIVNMNPDSGEGDLPGHDWLGEPEDSPSIRWQTPEIYEPFPE